MLIESMKKLIEFHLFLFFFHLYSRHVSSNKNNQSEILKSLSYKDLDKVLRNFNDENESNLFVFLSFISFTKCLEKFLLSFYVNSYMIIYLHNMNFAN